jgi:hypothetical protein
VIRVTRARLLSDEGGHIFRRRHSRSFPSIHFSIHSSRAA